MVPAPLELGNRACKHTATVRPVMPYLETKDLGTIAREDMIELCRLFIEVRPSTTYAANDELRHQRGSCSTVLFNESLVE